MPPTTVGVAVTASLVGKNHATFRFLTEVSVNVVRPSKVCWASWPYIGQSQALGAIDGLVSTAEVDETDWAQPARAIAATSTPASVRLARPLSRQPLFLTLPYSPSSKPSFGGSIRRWSGIRRRVLRWAGERRHDLAVRIRAHTL